jgi:DNA-binding NarL/FixJ family response regulator
VIKVILQVRQQLVADVLPGLLSRTRRFDILGVARDCKEAVLLAEEMKPEILAADVALGQAEVESGVIRIRRKCPQIRIVFFNGSVDHAAIRSALQVGVVGYLGSAASVSELARALETVHRGAAFFGSSVAQLIEEEYIRRMTAKSGLRAFRAFQLTVKEHEIADRVSRGEQNKAIATDLGISVRTVEKHRQNIEHKLHCDTPRRRVE